MKQFVSVYLPAILFIGVCIALMLWPAPIAYLRTFIEGHTFASYIAFVALIFTATVLMPVTAMPIVPVVAPIFGPFLTGVLSIVGWTTGAAVAFLLSRRFGRPLLARYVALSQLDEALERIPPETRFMTIVLIRMTLPVDIMSYALGLVRAIPFVPYLVATAIGVTWFSFAFAYAGDAFFTRDHTALIAVGVSSLVLFVGCWVLLVHHARRHARPRTDSADTNQVC